jgi:hypothetical protein
MSYPPFHQNFCDFHRTIECPLVLLRHTELTLGLPAALRRRVHPRKPIRTLPKDADVSTVNVRRGHWFRGQVAQDAFQLIEEVRRVIGDWNTMGFRIELLSRCIRWKAGN